MRNCFLFETYRRGLCRESYGGPRGAFLHGGAPTAAVQGFLADKKPHHPRTLQTEYAQGPMMVLCRGAISYERGTPLLSPTNNERPSLPPTRPPCMHPCRGTSIIRKRTPLGPYRRPMPRVLWGWAFSYGRGTPVSKLCLSRGPERVRVHSTRTSLLYEI